MEQLNIEGKRSGEGFVCHRERLVSALAKAQAALVEVVGFVLGRKGFLNYLRLLGGSNIVKIVPSNGTAGDSQSTEKMLKVVCGGNTGCLADNAWVGKGMEHSNICQVRVSPHNSVTPNLGGVELAEALSKVLPFVAAKKDERMVLKCVRFAQREGKLTLTAADGFHLADQSLDFEEGEGEILVFGHVIKGMVSALRKAKRVKVTIEQGKEKLDRRTLVIQTEAVTYRFDGYDGTYPNYEQVIPTEFVAEATFDTREMLRAGASLGALFLDKESPVIISIGDGSVRLYVKDEKGEAHIEAEAQGEAEIAINSLFLTQALRTLGGIVEMKVKAPNSPMLFSVDGHRVVLSPMLIGIGKKNGEGEADQIPKPEGEPEAEPEAAAHAEVKTDKPKRKHQPKHPVPA